MSAMRSQEARKDTGDAEERAAASRGAGLRARLSLGLLLAVSAAVVVAAAGNGRCRAQQSSMSNQQQMSTPRGFPQVSGPFSANGDPIDDLQAEKRISALNAERQRSMVSDSQKLLKLATELNNEIAQSNTGELTPAQLRVVAEIEKLAHNVREKMAMSVRGPQMPGNGIDAPYPPFPSPNHP